MYAYNVEFTLKIVSGHQVNCRYNLTEIIYNSYNTRRNLYRFISNLKHYKQQSRNFQKATVEPTIL